MNNQGVSQSCEIRSHDHSLAGGNLKQAWTKRETVRNGLGLVVGFKKVEIFQCKICGKSIEVINPNILPLREQ